MRSKLLLLMTGVAVLSLLWLLASCKRVHEDRAEDRAEVRVAYLQIIPSLPIFVAQEQGLFDKENLQLKAIALGSSNDLVNAMVAGQADILPATSLVPIIHLEIQSPGRVRIFSHSRMSDSNALDKIIVKEASPIHAIEGLRGKKIGVFPGTAPSHMLSAFFKKHGVDPAKISMVQLPPQAQISSLPSGAVDALFTYEPAATTALVHGGYRPLFGSAHSDLLNPGPICPSVVTPRFPRNHQPA